MRRIAVIAIVCCLFALPTLAAETLLVDFEDTDFTVTISTTTTPVLDDNIVLSNSTDRTEGDHSLQVTFNYVAQDPWYKNSAVVKVFETPKDISEMEFFRFDINVPNANPNLMMTINFVDELGYQARYVHYGAFTAATDGWETRTFSLSNLQKDRWVVNGRFINLKKITQIAFRILNGGAVGDGTMVFLLDNARFESNVGALNEIVLEDFESYANDAAIQAVWAAAFSGSNRFLETTNPYYGSKALRLNVNMENRWTNYAAVYNFSTPQDFSDADYFKIAVFGDDKLQDLESSALLFLEDSAGSRAMAFIWNWPAREEWVEMYMPFQNQGIIGFVSEWVYEADGNSAWREDRWDGLPYDQRTDLSQIVKMHVSISTQLLPNPSPYPISDVNILFDKITVGFATDDPPVPSVKNYDVNLVPVAEGPVINGIAGPEWDAASTPGCTGFVHHDDPSLAATEDPVIKALFTPQNLYILYQVVAETYAPGAEFAPPTTGFRDPTPAWGGNSYELFLYPTGNMSNNFYRFSFFTNPTDGICYVWDEAGSGYPGATSWDATGDAAAFTYDTNTKLLTIEYRIPWTAFNMPFATMTGPPSIGSSWGVQIGYSNNTPAEFVNWEPSNAAGFINGPPWGTWNFVGEFGPTTGTEDWSQYE